ncbi:MAG: SH3 domain-containing protein [Sulfurovaceae bacterium]|nr:SH3 domain-containing protein [Sulfurovaceae bacterium]
MLLYFSVLHADFYLMPSTRASSKIDNMPKAIIQDMQTIPQNPSFYANQIKPLKISEQKKLDNEYNEKYFASWKMKDINISVDDFGWETRFVREKPIYTAKAKIIPPDIYEEWISNAQMDLYNTQKIRAITIKRAELKSLPTKESFYRDPHQPGEGFPFDYNQNSAYPINMPLLISHFSKDGKWVFVQGAYAFGWLNIKDIAIVDDDFIKQFQNGQYAITVKDNLRLYKNSTPISLIKLGTIFPYDSNGYFFATKNNNGMAKLSKVRPTYYGIIAPKPIAFTSNNVARIASAFINEPYGWGENFEARDCSALTRDFFAPFGIFLNRNSSQQAKEGKQISLIGLTKEEKKVKIIQDAIPFRSMLFVPGHIVLYIGQYYGEPIIIHAYWGVRQKDLTKLITGRTIISTTEPGKELPTTKSESQLIETLQSIVSF